MRRRTSSSLSESMRSCASERTRSLPSSIVSIPPGPAGRDVSQVGREPRDRALRGGKAAAGRAALLQLPHVARGAKPRERDLEVAVVLDARLLEGGPAGRLHGPPA